MGLDIHLVKSDVPPEKFAEAYNIVRCRRDIANCVTATVNASLNEAAAVALKIPDEETASGGLTSAPNAATVFSLWGARHSICRMLKQLATLPEDYRKAAARNKLTFTKDAGFDPDVFESTTAYKHVQQFARLAEELANKIARFRVERFTRAYAEGNPAGVVVDDKEENEELVKDLTKMEVEFASSELASEIIHGLPLDFLLNLYRRMITFRAVSFAKYYSDAYPGCPNTMELEVKYISRWLKELAVRSNNNPAALEYCNWLATIQDDECDGRADSDTSWQFPESLTESSSVSSTLRIEADYLNYSLFEWMEEEFGKTTTEDRLRAILLTMAGYFFDENWRAFQETFEAKPDSPESVCKWDFAESAEMLYWRKDYRIVEAAEAEWREKPDCTGRSFYYESLKYPAKLYLRLEDGSFQRMMRYDIWDNWVNPYLGIERPASTKEALRRIESRRAKWKEAQAYLEKSAQNYLTLILSA